MARTTYYHADEVAALLNRHISDVYSMLKSGELKGYQTKRNRWLINKDQPLLSSFNKPSPKAKVPPKAKTFTKYIKDAEHESVLYKYLTGAKKSISIATADLKNLYIQNHSILEILDDKVGEGVEVRIICSSPRAAVIDNIQEYDNLLDTELFLRKECVRNHMKMVILDEKVAYVGSANLTNAAMGGKSDKKRNFEAGILTTEPDIVSNALDHFDEVWSDDICSTCKSKLCEFA